MVAPITEHQQSVQRQKISYEAYLELASENQINEWIDGEVITYMPPIFEHQNIVTFLNVLLQSFTQYFQLGQIIVAPFEVKLWPDGPSREPDILFISQAQMANLTDKRFEGAPDLVVEIVSPSSVTQDRVHKFNDYEQAGVKEYWLIDPRPHQQQADFYYRTEDDVFDVITLDDNGRFHSRHLPHFWLDPVWLRDKPLPNPQLCLAEIMVSVPDLSDEAQQTFQALYNLLIQQTNKLTNNQTL